MSALTAIARELAPLEVLQRFRPHDGTLDDFVAARREVQPDREMLACDGRSWTWREAEDTTARVAGRLQALGVLAGDRVLVMARNSAWHVFTLLAAARLGAILVPVNPQFKPDEARYVLGHCAPRCVLVDEEAEAVAGEAAGHDGPPILRLSDELASGPEVRASADGDPQRPCIIIYTSGTTGFPKGAMHSAASLVAAGEAFVERLHLQPDERMLLILPMFHINAMFYSVAGSLAAGATLLIERRFAASTFWRTVVELRATQVNIIEAVAAILLNRPAEEYIPGHPLRRIYGVRQAVMDRFASRFAVPVLVGGYAMTEIPGVLSTPVGEAVPAGSMGKLCRHPDPQRPWAHCRIVDDEGRDLPTGETGELWVRTPILMKGYFGDATQTAQSLRDGWFMTGDLVRADAEGWFYFVARKKDIIRRRGENVAGLELDRVVAEHPGVLVAAAIGVPSEFGDEDILVAVLPKPGHAPSERDIVEWCRQRLAPAKVPRFVALMEDLPFTPTHKVAKAELKKDTSLRTRAVDFG